MKAVLRGGALQNALDFAAYLKANGMTFTGVHCEVNYLGKCVCYLDIHGGSWSIWSEGEYGKDGDILSERMKEIAWANVSRCVNCGNKCSPGNHKTIFGKEFTHVCNAVMMFRNPDAEALACIKKLIEIRKLAIEKEPMMNPDIQKIFKLADDSTLRYKPEKLFWSWGQALYLYSLARVGDELGTEKYTEYLRRFYDHHIKKGYRLCSSDTSAPALGALYLALKTGEQRYCEVVKAAKRYFGTAKRVLGDMPNHLGSGVEGWFYPKSVWVDSIMMYGVFTNWLASVSRDEKYSSIRCEAAQDDEALRDFAARQPANFAKYLQDGETGLFYHSYWAKAKTHYPREPIFWGRGNGWVMAAVPLLLDYLPEEQRPHVKDFFTRLAAALLPYQRADGYFETVFNRPGETYKESSATMLIAAGWFYGYRTGLLDESYFEAAKKAFHAVTEDLRTKNGLLSMPYISGDTMPMPGIPYFNYKHTPLGNDRHFGLAAAFFAAVEYLRCEEADA